MMNSSNHTRENAIRSALIIIGLAAVVVGAAIFAAVYGELAKLGAPEPSAVVAPQDEFFEEDDQTAADADTEQLDPGLVSWPPGVEVISNLKVVNILLIGQDRLPGQSRQRSDSIMICSYDTEEKTLKLVSLLRDMYVPIPNYSDNRINATYQFGGMPLLDKTIESDFGVKIDGNIEVDFDGFSRIVDILGGVDIELYQAEAEFLNEKYGWETHAGVNHFDGQKTLAYTRIRYVGNADYERTERQRTVLQLLFGRIITLDIAEKLKLLDEILPYLTTDVSKLQLLQYACTILQNGIAETESYRLPVDGTFHSAKIRNMWVLVPDLAANRSLLKAYLYN